MSNNKILSAPARKAQVVLLIRSGQVHSQSDLVRMLEKSGFAVTQATVSRDLEDIGAVRGRNSVGEMVYQIPEGEVQSLSRTSYLPADLILSVESSANIAVVRTPPGGAQLLASALDSVASHGQLHSVIGTIAGDDTVLVIARKSDGGAALAKELRLIAQGNQRKVKSQ
ncbi:MAG: arginine repressor [Actinobacteria bacterium]|nr:arginine repressor [Actinomycetota bacterium]